MKTVAKKKRQRGDTIGALDIGTHKVSVAIASYHPKDHDKLKLLGLGQQSSKGMGATSMTDMDALGESILNAVHTAEQKAEHTLDSLYVSLPASLIQSTVVSVEMDVGSEPVDSDHLRHLLTLGQHLDSAKKHHIIHAIPISYGVDDQDHVRDPKGMFCQKLRARIHMLYLPKTILRNLSACIGRCHLNIKGFVVSSYAAGLATLVDDELELGVSVIDIGGSATTVASFLNGTLVYLASIPLGSQSITHDIARGLSTPMSQAERLKTLYGSISPLHVVDGHHMEEREHIIVPQLGEEPGAATHQVPKSFLLKVIRARVEEIFEHVGESLDRSPLGPRQRHRIVLTGGGSQMPGLSEFLSHQWSCPVRIGASSRIEGIEEYTKNPSFSTCFGLMEYALRDKHSHLTPPTSKGPRQTTHDHLWQRFLRWFKENF